jgi:hypothetical protein
MGTIDEKGHIHQEGSKGIFCSCLHVLRILKLGLGRFKLRLQQRNAIRHLQIDGDDGPNLRSNRSYSGRGNRLKRQRRGLGKRSLHRRGLCRRGLRRRRLRGWLGCGIRRGRFVVVICPCYIKTISALARVFNEGTYTRTRIQIDRNTPSRIANTIDRNPTHGQQQLQAKDIDISPDKMEH